MNEPPVPPPPPSHPAQPPTESQVRMWNMWCHLSALAGLVGVPFGNVLGPLVVWQIKKNEIPSVDAHGKAALNFQLTITLAAVAVGIVGFVLTFILIGFLLLPIALLIGICGLVFGVIAAVKVNEGKDYRYPFSFEFIK